MPIELDVGMTISNPGLNPKSDPPRKAVVEALL